MVTSYTSFLFSKVPKYLLDKRSQIIMVLFVSIFAIIFINIFKPFESSQWIENRGFTATWYFAWSSALVLLGMTVVAISRVIMYKYSKKPTHSITVLRYAIWVFVEFLLLAGAFTILAIITTERGNIKLESYDPLVIYMQALRNTVFIIFIPYLICMMSFSYKDKNEKLKELMNENIGFKGSSLISFRDERGVLQLSVAKENLLYIESADNYICIWYIKNEQLKKQLMRITMKEISEQLAETNIVRCHRSYMVNLDVVKVMRREKENLFLELGYPNIKEIPISKTYGEQVLRRLIPIS
ncbi:MAG: LytTR family transcriptional regulator [Bacteroidaceae bacterium]|nr:LytTR family transcriptional regulator [Bacteroidaceae bacterium]